MTELIAAKPGNVKHYKAVFFDMDGTVLNTLEDLTIALNYAMEQTGHRHDHPPEMVRYFFGSGIRVAIRRVLALEKHPDMTPAELLRIDKEATDHDRVSSPDRGIMADSFNEPADICRTDQTGRRDHCSQEAFSETLRQPDPEEIQRILTIYQPYYEKHCSDHTKPYPGITDLLQELCQRETRTAVISNKPDAAVQVLVERLFPGMFDYAAGERNGTARKPAPDLVLRAAEAMQLKPDEILYVGDSEIDLQTAENAGMDCVAVTWGFRDREMLEKLQPTFLIDSSGELAGLL